MVTLALLGVATASVEVAVGAEHVPLGVWRHHAGLAAGAGWRHDELLSFHARGVWFPSPLARPTRRHADLVKDYAMAPNEPTRVTFRGQADMTFLPFTVDSSRVQARLGVAVGGGVIRTVDHEPPLYDTGRIDIPWEHDVSSTAHAGVRLQLDGDGPVGVRLAADRVTWIEVREGYPDVEAPWATRVELTWRPG